MLHSFAKLTIAGVGMDYLINAFHKNYPHKAEQICRYKIF